MNRKEEEGGGEDRKGVEKERGKKGTRKARCLPAKRMHVCTEEAREIIPVVSRIALLW